MTPTTVVPAVVDLAKEATKQRELSIMEKVQAWTVSNDEEFVALDAYLVSIKDFEKMIEADFEESETKARDAKREATNALAAIVAQKDRHLGKAAEARTLGKQKLFAYEQKKKAEAEAERVRLEAEARRKAEDEALARADAAEKAGDKEAASEILKEPLVIQPATRLSQDIPKRQTTIQTRWGATIGGKREDGTQTDPMFVLHAIEAAGKVLAKSKAKDAQEAVELLRQAHKDAGYLVYDQTALNRQAVATKDAVKLGGVAFNPKRV